MLNRRLLIIALTLFICFCNSCLNQENINLPLESDMPGQLNDGWEISTPEQEGFSADKIDDVYARVFSDNLYPNLHSLLIVRNGKLVAEAYTKDNAEREMFHNLVSVTKSVTSILTGIAIDKGFIESVNTPVYQIIPAYFNDDVRKREITVHHVLTMETGLNFDNDIHTNEMFFYSGSSLEYVLNKELIFLPGTDWYYGYGNPQLISGIIEATTGKSEKQFAKEYLFGPLGITNFHWEKHSDGLNYGAKGLWLRPRDMAKIGQLMVLQGIWHGEQIVSSEWIAKSTKHQASHANYGYYWYPVDNYDAFFAEGHGGQWIFVAPQKQLVIVMTSDPYAKSYLLSADYYEIINGILNALKE